MSTSRSPRSRGTSSYGDGYDRFASEYDDYAYEGRPYGARGHAGNGYESGGRGRFGGYDDYGDAGERASSYRGGHGSSRSVSSGGRGRAGSAARDPFEPQTAPDDFGGAAGGGAQSGRGSSRGSYGSGSGTTARRFSRDRYETKMQTMRKKRKRKQVALGAVAAVVVVALVAVVGYAGSLFGKLGSGIDGDLRAALVHTDMAREPFYMLLMGTDRSEERAEGGDYGDSFRSDSIMLARIDAPNKKVTLVSIHRDSMVDMGEYGQQKLNAARALGGPALAVETVSKMAGVPISHYAEIDFDGFRGVVDALGGIEVDVPMAIDDWEAGGSLERGLQTLSGEQALILCRSRHAYDDWGDGDSYRAANQRLVLSAIAKKLLASDIATMAGTVQSMADYVSTDLSVTDIVGLAQALQGLDSGSDIYTAMEPTESAYIDDVWWEITDQEAWSEMMRRVDAGLPPTEGDVVDDVSGTILASAGTGNLDGRDSSKNADGSQRRDGTVAIRNGNGIAGAGEVAAERVKALGYTADADNADAFDYPRTLVIYGSSSQEEAAVELAAALGFGADSIFKNDGTYGFTADFLVVLGADWE